MSLQDKWERYMTIQRDIGLDCEFENQLIQKEKELNDLKQNHEKKMAQLNQQKQQLDS